MGRVLALDYGSARCGCALSDPTATLARPIDPVLSPQGAPGMERLRELVRRHGVERVIVGLPLSLSGADSEQTREARSFSERLARQLGPDVPVELFDERFTTRLARRSQSAGGWGPTATEDSRAAAHLLETWLAARRPSR